MRSSPRRPLILKRRRLPPAARDEAARRAPGAGAAAELAGAGIRVTAHPSLPRTQVVAIPPGADLRSVIEALTAKGKGCGSDGPTKFILISGAGTASASALSPARRLPPGGSDPGPPGQGQTGGSSGDMTSCALDNSLTNIQWLGRMSSDGLSPSTVKQEMEKENQTPVQVEGIKIEEDSSAVASTSTSSWQDSISERPPYSYMAMIQFAINSTEKKRMTLKDIYTWIEDHFPYFKHVAKPGWKNSIRHNLSLHDMFVRETSANGKISFWTIHPDANRYLTLDQVFKPLDAGSPTSPEHSESQQKRHISELQKTLGGSSCSKTEAQNARRKMKPLLPRVNSYLVPIQFPVSQPLVLQSSVKVPLSVAQGASLNSLDTGRSSKRVRIAPKVLSSEEPSPFPPVMPVKEENQCEEGPSPFASAQSMQENVSQTGREPTSFPEALHIKEEHEGSCPDEWLSPLPPGFSIKEEPVQPDEEQGLFLPVPPGKQEKHFTMLKSPPRGISDTLVINRRERREMGRSRRKQRLVLPCSEEPLLVLPESSSSDSFRLASELPHLQETQPLENMSQLSCCQEEGGPFKTPVKEMFCKLPISSTPSKVPAATPPMGGLNPWRSVPLAKENSTLDFSPVRTPLQENLDLLGFNSTPFKNPLFESPRELLNTESNDMVSGPLPSSPASNPESTKQLSSPELPASGLPENRSLMEGLVLDTMNDSLSKILLDISFPGLEDDNLATDISWSQLIPELRSADLS
ncbi:PREDICTED: forkhead box protein M1 isoform X1 [Crocodylus porosus]|uniref:forkhead box protein M1 isoform X1 n=1 Tax=Crocodylus porosus TaxID=8502 RepID=UPI00093DD652|nr:PREDICTED: forkhead box protein M1 isoform X1 [Crocodylus porosus]